MKPHTASPEAACRTLRALLALLPASFRFSAIRAARILVPLAIIAAPAFGAEPSPVRSVQKGKSALSQGKSLAASESSSSPAAASLVHDFSGSLVFLESGGSAGSGFVCKLRAGATYLFTNIHVIAGMPYVRVTRLDNSVVPGGPIHLAVGHDLACMTTPAVPNPLVAAENVEADVRIDDEVVVLGNSEGSRVIQPLAGRILGIGPDRIEISAEIVPGNSGSPIIHVKSGKVIAVATYLTQRRFSELADETKSKVRRFGYRIDSVKKWQPIVWSAFQAEHAAVEKVKERTHDFERLFGAIQEGKTISADAFGSAISRPVQDFVTAVGRGSMSEPDRKYAFRSLLTSLRSVSRSDILQTRERLRYDFFQRAVSEEAETREQVYKIFDNSVKAN